jgi:heme-binding protein
MMIFIKTFRKEPLMSNEKAEGREPIVGTRMKTISAVVLVGITGFIIIAQSLPARRTNPSSNRDFAAPPEISALLRRACYDCHSNETRWPWYGHVAPVSSLIAWEVESGRRELNFSEWDSYYPLTRRRKLQWIDRVLRERRMPPWSYVVLHRDAWLSAKELGALEHWIQSEFTN